MAQATDMTSEPSSNDDQRRFEQEAARFRAVLAKARSANQLQIFDFLVARSTDPRSPKEIEIALALSGDAASLEPGVDSGVRVYVHRLRKRLDDYYLNRPGLRLVIPKGEYRIVMEGAATPPLRRERWRPLLDTVTGHPALSAGLALIMVALLALVGWTTWRLQQGSVVNSAQAARPVAGLFGGQPPLIVVGDRMLVAESDDQRSVQRMILDPRIRSRDDLGEYLKANPQSFYRLYDFNLHFAPIASVEAAWRIGDEVRGDGNAATTGNAAAFLPVSALTPDLMRSRNLLYVGRLSQLGVLEPSAFAHSRLRLAAFDRLIDGDTQRTFVADVYSEAHQQPRIDYGYLAFQSGPEGRVVGVVGGLGDLGTAAMTELLADPRELMALRAKTGNGRFEALFEFRMRQGFSASRKLILLRKLP